MHYLTEELTIQAPQVLIKPEKLTAELPLTPIARDTVKLARQKIRQIMAGDDDRLLVIVGPCSIHDPEAALEYGSLLNQAAKIYADKLCIVMRTYFEKPRTTIGWKGLISDPYLNGTSDINYGISLARELLIKLNNEGLPTATEFLDALIPQYLSDLISWCAIGARTSESQLHRELASSLLMPVGFKNSTDGNFQIAIDAVQVAAQPHQLLTINQQGIPVAIRTSGNQSTHIVLRGSNSSVNYSSDQVQDALSALKSANLNPRLMIDCSHGNSMKNYSLQREVIHSVIKQINRNPQDIFGVMIESHLIAGKQALTNKESLTYGQSITDACIGWDETLELFELLANSKHSR